MTPGTRDAPVLERERFARTTLKTNGSTSLCAMFVIGFAVGCGPKPEDRPAPPPPPPPAAPRMVAPAVVSLTTEDVRLSNLRCFAPESLKRSAVVQYGEGSSDTTTGDVSALAFRFTITSAGMTGEAVEVTGDAVESDPLTELAVDVRKETIQFAYEEGENRARFLGAISCDSLWGRWEPYPRQVRPNKTFKRMR